MYAFLHTMDNSKIFLSEHYVLHIATFIIYVVFNLAFIENLVAPSTVLGEITLNILTFLAVLALFFYSRVQL